MKILLVDGSIEQQFSKLFQVSKLVARLKVCLSAAAACETLQGAAAEFDIAVVDQDLPDLSGLELCQQLLRLQPSISLVLLVTEKTETLISAAHRIGIDLCLLKPANAEQFSQLPAALLEISRRHQDRLAREKLVAELRDSIKRLKRIVEASTVATFVIDDEHRITDWNRACERLTGLSAREMLGTRDAWRALYAAPRPTMADLIVDGQMAAEFARHFGDEFRKSTQGEGYEAEDYYPGFCGSGGWLFVTAAPLKSGPERIVGAIVTLQNVTESRRAVEQLEQTATWLTQILNSSTVPTFVIDNQHQITHWNHACELLTGVEARQVVGTKEQWRAFYDQPRPVMADLIVDKVIEAEMAKHYTSGYCQALLGHGYEAEEFFPHLGDAGRWLFFTAAPLRSAAGEIVGALETLQDITERRNAEVALAESQRRLSQIIQGSAVPTFVIDSGHRITEWNLACENLTGLKAAQMLGTSDQWKAFSLKQRPVLADFILDSASQQAIFRQYGDRARSTLVGEGYEVEDFFPALGGDGRWLFFTAAPLRDTAGKIVGAIETLQDVTRRRNAEDALRSSEQHYRELSLTDGLTGLYNARYFRIRLAEEIARAERHQHPLSLLMLDMDDFKSYNDSYGHPEGDLVLQGFAAAALHALRSVDSVYRYGGEEFVVLLPETPLAEAIAVAERIRRDFSREIFNPSPETAISKTLSVGVAEYIAGEDEADLLARADRYLYQAKRNGKIASPIARGRAKARGEMVSIRSAMGCRLEGLF